MNLLDKILPKKGSGSNYFLTLDIGTDFVKTLAIQKTEEGPKVVAASKQSLPWGAVRGGMLADEMAVLESVKQALEEIKSNLESLPNQIIVGLSGELICNFTTVARLTRKNSLDPISEKELKSIHQKIEEVAFIEGSKSLSIYASGQDVDIEMITSEVLSTRIDNFVIENPVSFKGEVVETTLFSAYAIKSHLDTVRRVFKKLKITNISFCSNLYSLTRTLGGTGVKSFNTVLIDVGGETTDIAVIFGGAIVGSRTLGLGGRFFSEILSQKLGVSFNEADIRKVSYTDKKLSPENMEIIATSLDTLTPIWLDGLELALSDIEGVKTLPNQVIVVGGGSQLPEVIEFIRDYPWGKSLPFNWPLTVKSPGILELPIKAESNLEPGFFNTLVLGINYSSKF